MNIKSKFENIKLLIFDLDGTLYKLNERNFRSSAIYNDMRDNSINFLCKKLNVSKDNATEIYESILVDYNCELSIGFEKEFGIDRHEYFKQAWDIDASKHIARNDKLVKILNILKQQFKLVVLTDAPRIWAERVLATLNVSDVFEDNILTGEGDLRKSFGNTFLEIVKRYSLSTSECIVIGDHKKNDIDFAKAVGMKTIYIGDTPYEKSDYSVKDICEIADIFEIKI
ncbi:MAG: HAD family hydrolase [bacterium]|nr:HAD family hydrolase [bacterium]